jgi:hypothetical protein
MAHATQRHCEQLAGHLAVQGFERPAIAQRALRQQLPEFIGVDRRDKRAPGMGSAAATQVARMLAD